MPFMQCSGQADAQSTLLPLNWQLLLEHCRPNAKRARGLLCAEDARPNAKLLETVNNDGMPYLVMVTVEPIPAGDEILISYSDGFWDGHATAMKQLHVLAVSPCPLQSFDRDLCVCAPVGQATDVPCQHPGR